MGDSILSQAEIDALLNGDSGSEEPEIITANETDVKPYDPTTQRRVVRERLHALEIINERFARQFRMGLFNLLRRSPDITVGPIKIQPYHDFARNLPVPTNLNLVHLKPLRGTALFVFAPSLVFIAVDNLFGGMAVFQRKWKAVNLPIPSNGLSPECCGWRWMLTVMPGRPSIKSMWNMFAQKYR